MNLYTLLDQLQIPYSECEHSPVYTMEDAEQEKISERIEGKECKVLFLKHKKRYYLVLLPGEKRADLKAVAEAAGEPKLAFGSEERLFELLHLTPGAVTPLAIIYDEEKQVKVLTDSSLKGENLLMHPCVNTKTVSIKYEDLLTFIQATGHEYIEIPT